MTEAAENTVAVEKVKEAKAEKPELSMAFFENAKVICASCGNTFTTGSTKKEIHIEVCNNCHPFFTGQEKFVDTEGRVERFQRLTEAKKAPKAKKEVEKSRDDRPKTLKEMLQSLDKA